MDPALALEVSSLGRLRSISEALSSGSSEIQRSYQDAAVFITGGTGFLGKHCIEKLLRATKVKTIFVLIRPKKGKTVQERLTAILEDPLFDSVKKLETEFASRLQAVAGDITELKLGLSEQDRELLSEEVNFIFHVAATTRFDESIPSATYTNVRGTREVVHLARSCKHLRALVHVSTAFTHATYSRAKKPVDEQFYEVPVSPEELIDIVERGDTEAIEHVQNFVMKDWPNTYCFTKAVAEEVIRTMAGCLPVCIVRPAIVICAYREPAPGWLDTNCTYGPGGVMIGIGLGVVHTILSDRDVKIAVTPADFVNNAVIAAGHVTAANRLQGYVTAGSEGPVRIYTVTNNRNPTTWGALSDVHRTESRKISTPRAVWYCYCVETTSKPLFWMLFTLLHTVPALLIDFFAMLFGMKPRFHKLSSKAYKLFTLFSTFTTNEWQFSDRNLLSLYKSLNAADRAAFNFDIQCLDWKELMLVWCLGCRKYIIKDGLTGTDYAVKKQFWFRIANFIFLVVYAYLWYSLFAFVFNGVRYLF